MGRNDLQLHIHVQLMTNVTLYVSQFKNFVVGAIYILNIESCSGSNI